MSWFARGAGLTATGGHDGGPRFYSQFLEAGDLVFDVGANVGDKTALLRRLGTRVVCIEPQPDCVKALRARYRDDAQVTIVAEGLASVPGVMPLSICESANAISTFSRKWTTGRFRGFEWNASIDVPVSTLDILIGQFGTPAFCKVDVEGFESEVLRGLSIGIPMIAFEFTIEFLDDARTCVDQLTSIGDYELNYTRGEELRFVLHECTDAGTLFRALSADGDSLLWGDIYARLRRVARAT
jgi:FkbM family methyltransferase